MNKPGVISVPRSLYSARSRSAEIFRLIEMDRLTRRLEKSASENRRRICKGGRIFYMCDFICVFKLGKLISQIVLTSLASTRPRCLCNIHKMASPYNKFVYYPENLILKGQQIMLYYYTAVN